MTGTGSSGRIKDRASAVLDVRGMVWASEQNVVAVVLGRRPGVLAVEADVESHRVAVGNRRLMDAEGIRLGDLAARQDELAAGGRTAVIVAVDGRAAGLIGIADARRQRARSQTTAAASPRRGIPRPGTRRHVMW